MRKQRGGTKNQVSIVEVHLGSKLSVRATWGGHTHHAIYCHFTCDDEAEPFQWTRRSYPPPTGPREGPFFGTCGSSNTASLSFQRMDLNLTEFQRSTRSCGPKERARQWGHQPGPNNRALTTGGDDPGGAAILKITFAELVGCSI
jgi:hypothetical protein